MRSRKSGLSSPQRRRRRGPVVVLCAVLACLAPGTARLAAAADQDEPGVARVALVEGDASYLRGDAEDWTGVAVNAPLVTGDRFYTGADSRAEIQLDPATYARLSSETEVSMLELGPEVTQVRMSLGLATFRVRRDPQGRHVEIDTPGAAFVVREAGVYRVTVARNGDTDLQVRDGEVTAWVANEQYQIGDGRGVAIDGIGDAARPRIYAASGADGWDEWESQRAGRIENAVSTQYVSEDIYGAADLDDHGDWQATEEYGPVWRPRVAAGWAPYTDGRWVWVDPWGWTWLDYAPWGWAPFHYGRWVYSSGWWGWAPGPIVAAPVYAPALVGWYGGGWGGVSVSVGVGFGAIGWTPLGWGEPCFPWWGGWGGVVVGTPWWGGWGGPRFYQKNVTNITINNYDYGNRRHPGGFSSMPIREFQDGRGRPVPVGSRSDSFRALGGRVPVAPTRDSLPATDPSRGFGGRAIQPPGNLEGRGVMTARTPTAGAQPSFERKLPEIRRGQGTPLTPTTLRELGRQGGRAPLVQPVSNPDGAGRQVRTLPATTAPDATAPKVEADAGGGRRSPFGGSGTVPQTGSGDGGSGFARSGAERAGAPRQTMTFDGAGARTLPDGGSGAGGPGTADARTIARPPAGGVGDGDGGRGLPVAPREGSGGREPYVARRPAWSPPSGGSGSGGAGTGRGAVGDGQTSPRTTWGGAPSNSGARSPGTSGSGRALPGGSVGTDAASGGGFSSRAVPGGSAPSRSVPGGSVTRAAPSAPRGGSPATYPPAVRTAPAPDRGGSRSYFSAPRTATRGPAGGTSADPRSAMRSAPTSRGTQGGSAPRSVSGGRSYGSTGSAPRVQSAPAGRTRAPAAYGSGSAGGAPTSGRSMSSLSSGGGSASRSLSAGMGRASGSAAMGGSAGSFSRGGGFGGGSMGAGRASGGGMGGGRSFGGGMGGGGGRGS